MEPFGTRQMEITTPHIAEFVKNLNVKERLNLPITVGHDNGMSGGELPAIGWRPPITMLSGVKELGVWLLQ